MAWTLDARIPVRFGTLADAGEGDALLMEEDFPNPPSHPAERFEPSAPNHGPGCACCAPRSGAALALNRLFQARARGEVSFFRRVLAVTATAEGDLEVWSALRSDPVVSARFREDTLN